MYSIPLLFVTTSLLHNTGMYEGLGREFRLGAGRVKHMLMNNKTGPYGEQDKASMNASRKQE